MSDIYQGCKCLDHEDKKLMIKVIDEAIDREILELKKIQARRLQSAMKPPYVEYFQGIRSSLARVHEDYKKSIEQLKQNIERYPKCILAKPTIDTKLAVPIPEAEIPLPYAERKLF